MFGGQSTENTQIWSFLSWLCCMFKMQTCILTCSVVTAWIRWRHARLSPENSLGGLIQICTNKVSGLLHGCRHPIRQHPFYHWADTVLWQSRSLPREAKGGPRTGWVQSEYVYVSWSWRQLGKYAVIWMCAKRGDLGSQNSLYLQWISFNFVSYCGHYGKFTLYSVLMLWTKFWIFLRVAI